MNLNYSKLVRMGTIDLRRRELNDIDIEVLTKVLRKSSVLKSLILVKNALTLADGKFTDALAHNRTLRTLNLLSNNIGDQGAKMLAGALKVNKTLEKLHLGDNKISDHGAKSLAGALATNQTLREIWLEKNKISGEGGKRMPPRLAYHIQSKARDFIKDQQIAALKTELKRLQEFISSEDKETDSLKNGDEHRKKRSRTENNSQRPIVPTLTSIAC